MAAGVRRDWLWFGAVAALVAEAALLVHPTRSIDLAVYRMAAQALLRGEAGSALYLLHTRHGLSFTYPPFAALLFAPLALARMAVVQVGVHLLLCLVLAGLWTTSLKTAGFRPRRLVLVALVAGSLLLEPVWQDVKVGQVSLVLVLMVVADLGGAVPARFRGVLTGLAAAIKLTPLVFLVLLALTRQWRALARAVAAFGAAAAVGFAALPRASWDYWTRYLADARRVGSPTDPANQSLHGALVRLGLPAHGTGAELTWIAGAVVVAGAALVLGAAWWRRGERLLGIGLTAVGGLLLSPVSWYHHWCWVVPLAVALARLSAVAAGLFVVPALLLRHISIASGWQADSGHWSPLAEVIGNGYVWLGLLTLGYAAWRLRRPRGSVLTGAPARDGRAECGPGPRPANPCDAGPGAAA